MVFNGGLSMRLHPPDGEREEIFCPYLNSDLNYSLGVEFGVFVCFMQAGEQFSGYFFIENQEQMLLLVNRMGWQVKEMERHDDEWFFMDVEPPGEGK